MVTLIRPWPTHRAQGRRLYQIVMPLLAGGAMLGASVLPWLLDPLGAAFSAWQLPVDVGWQVHSGIFSYGLLCFFCSIYAFLISYLSWREGSRRDYLPYEQAERTITTTPLQPPTRRGSDLFLPTFIQPCRGSGLSLSASTPTSTLRRHFTLAGLLCLMPISLFFIQYLFIDMKSIAQLAQHEFQSVFIQRHFGYRVAAPFIPIRLDTFDPSTFSGRFALILNHIQPGLYFPFLGTLCLLRGRAMLGQIVGTGQVQGTDQTGHDIPPTRFRTGASPVPTKVKDHGSERFSMGVTIQQQSSERKRRRVKRATIPLIVCSLVLLVVLGRGPAALVCRFQAKHLLSSGAYADALIWLNRASTLNESLREISAYHIERGQAHYYLHPTQSTIESQAYLASFYLTQDDYLSAYQELMAIRQRNLGRSTPSWLVNDLDITLTRLAEMQHPLNGPPALRPQKNLPSITWLNILTQIDPSNAYAHYTLGRIKYDLHDFTACEKQMLSVINLSSDHNILSSVYTYLSLSSEAQGNYVKARDYLFKAQEFDPSYHNNTAREEMSGLH